MKTITADALPLYAMSDEDVQKFIKWAYLMKGKTKFNMRVMTHPRMCMTRALMDDEAELFIPLQPVLMYDVLTPSPNLTNKERAICMAAIGEMVEKRIMPDTGMYDAYFTCNDEAEVKAVCKVGWEVIMHDPERHLWLLKKSIAPTKEASNE